MIDVALLQALVDAGASSQNIVDAVKASQDGTNERKAAAREAERIRKWRYRSRMKALQAESNDSYVPNVPNVPRDVPDIGKKRNGINGYVPDVLARADNITSSSSITQQEKKESTLDQNDWPSDFRDQFWQRYPRKIGKGGAIRKLECIRKRGVPWAIILAGIEKIDTEDLKFVPHPLTWLNQGRWDDEPGKKSDRNKWVF